MLQINTRADLEALAGSEAYGEALQMLKGSMTAAINVAVYPEGYFEEGYVGPTVEPVWETRESLEALDLLGIGREAFLAEYARVFPEAYDGTHPRVLKRVKLAHAHLDDAVSDLVGGGVEP